MQFIIMQPWGLKTAISFSVQVLNGIVARPHSRSATMIARAKRAWLPILHIVDGVVKWGTAWPSLTEDAVKHNDDMGRTLHSLFAWDERCMLMQAMIEIAEQHRSEGKLPTFPVGMVPGFDYTAQHPYHYAPDRLFPAHPIFSRPDSSEMARELANLQHYCSLLEKNFENLTQDFSLGLVVKSKVKIALHRLFFLRRARR